MFPNTFFQPLLEANNHRRPNFKGKRYKDWQSEWRDWQSEWRLKIRRINTELFDKKKCKLSTKNAIEDTAIKQKSEINIPTIETVKEKLHQKHIEIMNMLEARIQKAKNNKSGEAQNNC